MFPLSDSESPKTTIGWADALGAVGALKACSITMPP
jgi:hypothetical protein